ncbi:hypothetical protein NYR55_03665 [Sphingomonas sp. BGYR3]|uniref:hypothetical protein n=1 Tax=Sphingomonas sp. BGYR3 TaxID=2975483 RepID=UPI0021A34A0F|nr:hypothetical protein [Sphingomonas sp. BGYR3]MDG5487723.1 hypothetical protein [Sphingomonas sp. BGYR3]
MQALFTSGHAVDIVLAVLVVEAVWLRHRGQRLSNILPALLPAVLMMLGLRAALTGWAWPWIAVPLALAFPVHLIDLRRRRMLGRRMRG